MLINWSEDRPIGKACLIDPILQGTHGTPSGSPVWNANLPAFAALVGFASHNGDDKALLNAADVLDIERNQLCAPEGSGKSHEQQRAIANCFRVIAHTAEDGEQIFFQQRLRLSLLTATSSPYASQRGLHQLGSCRVGC
jgi:hypothetical protein